MSRLGFHNMPSLLRDLCVAVLFVALAAAAAAGLLMFNMTHTSMIFLAAVSFSAVTAGTRSALIAAPLAFLVYDFFWLPPIYTFQITTPEEGVTLLAFILVAIVTGVSSGGLRDRNHRAELRARTLLALVQNHGFFVTPGQAAIRMRLAEAAASVARTGAVVTDGAAQVDARAGGGTAWRGALDQTIQKLARRAIDSGGDARLSEGSFRARQIRYGEQVLGAVVWLRPEGSQDVERECEDYVAILSEVAAAALARAE